ncbi:DHA2 family efflux MFS transporter permease subunit [Paenibacillus sp. SYP-B3998]|uniref:DHA2 family efflux MFS transporter permease subunit n=1 Tax=Paenibacillus sp. SYP-B3998 TaxID=2678564 RepID=A0A6G3ZW66_9BACL|nr:DHA2 family efflux MFS transporter permease subunit [Paenibacillus sp. SYP-B3998]NEW06372.1 DHA2 family efflux MFS transporter permease subunit [Paenibacillus sp. SYP-B3998]
MSIRLNPKVVVSIVYVAAMFMAAMDATIVNVALRTISNDLLVPPSAIGTVNVGYLVSLAVFLPVAGWLGDRWGTKRIFLLALGVFTLASALCGLADSLSALTLFRVIQGAGGGLLTPVGMAMLFRTFPPQERAKVSRILVLPIALAPALGPIVSGLLVDQFSWRWVFYVNLPVGILALLFGFIYLKEHKELAAGRLDLPGFLLSLPGLSLVVYALSQGSSRGWSSPEIVGLGGVGILLIAALVFVELRVSKPMLDLRLLTDRLFRTMGLISMFSAAGLLGMLYVFPLMYQEALHASALDTGLTTFPEALGLMLASQITPWSYHRQGPRRLITISLLCAAAIFVLLSLIDQATNPWFPRMLLFGAGFFLGHAVGSVQIASFANIPPSSMGRASTLFTVQNRLGSAFGMALLASVLAAIGTSTVDVVGAEQPNLAAYRVALLGAAVFLLVALLFALRIRDADAAPTMRKRPPVESSAVASEHRAVT